MLPYSITTKIRITHNLIKREVQYSACKNDTSILSIFRKVYIFADLYELIEYITSSLTANLLFVMN